MNTSAFLNFIKGEVTERIFSANITIQAWTTILTHLVNKTGGAFTYRFSLTQAGTANPTVAVFFNSLGATITLARTSAGVYTFTASKATFTADKTIIPNPIPVYVAGVLAKTISFERTSTTVITATVKDLTNTSVDLDGTINDITFGVIE